MLELWSSVEGKNYCFYFYMVESLCQAVTTSPAGSVEMHDNENS